MRVALALVPLLTACAIGGGALVLPVEEPPADAGAALGADATAEIRPPPADAAAEADAARDAEAEAEAEAGDGVLEAPASVGAKATRGIVLSGSLARLTLNSCQGSSIGFSIPTPYAYLALRNPDPSREAVVSVWTSRAPGGPILDTLMAAYARPTPPATDAERRACSVGVEKRCRAHGGDATACLEESGARSWAGLMDGDGQGVTIPPGAVVTIYVASYDGSAGPLVVSARTER